MQQFHTGVSAHDSGNPSVPNLSPSQGSSLGLREVYRPLLTPIIVHDGKHAASDQLLLTGDYTNYSAKPL